MIEEARIIAYSNVVEYALDKIAEHAQGRSAADAVIQEHVREAFAHLAEIRVATSRLTALDGER